MNMAIVTCWLAVIRPSPRDGLETALNVLEETFSKMTPQDFYKGCDKGGPDV